MSVAPEVVGRCPQSSGIVPHQAHRAVAGVTDQAANTLGTTLTASRATEPVMIDSESQDSAADLVRLGLPTHSTHATLRREQLVVLVNSQSKPMPEIVVSARIGMTARKPISHRGYADSARRYTLAGRPCDGVSLPISSTPPAVTSAPTVVRAVLRFRSPRSAMENTVRPFFGPRFRTETMVSEAVRLAKWFLPRRWV